MDSPSPASKGQGCPFLWWGQRESTAPETRLAFTKGGDLCSLPDAKRMLASPSFPLSALPSALTPSFPKAEHRRSRALLSSEPWIRASSSRIQNSPLGSSDGAPEERGVYQQKDQLTFLVSDHLPQHRSQTPPSSSDFKLISYCLLIACYYSFSIIIYLLMPTYVSLYNSICTGNITFSSQQPAIL